MLAKRLNDDQVKQQIIQESIDDYPGNCPYTRHVSLCVSEGKPVTLQHEGRPYRFIPSAKLLLQELEQAQFDVVEWQVRQRDKFSHINVFARRER